ncbi:MAG: DsbA family protein [Solirubrobacterales bacterium]|nr:DsbA family protein [Solirubrobacterales bacterium]
MDARAQPTFFYDLGDPGCYLVAERISSALPIVAEWEPVSASALGVAIDEVDREQIARDADAYGLQEVRWPPAWPPDSQLAMLAATYAKRIGRVVSFSLAAFRQAFAGGRDLGDQDTVLIAAAASEMHPAATLKGVSLRSVAEGLELATDRARGAGVSSLPAIQLGDQVWAGADPIAEAARVMGATGAQAARRP